MVVRHTHMRYFFRRYIPGFSRVLLVESGGRHIVDNLLPFLYEEHGDSMILDLYTCYEGVPSNYKPERGSVYRASDFQGPAARKRLFQELAANKYAILGIVCSAEPILTKWKWALAARLRSKVLVVNENGDHFLLDWGNWKTIVQFTMARSGLAEPGTVRAFARIFLFPFTLVYLLLYAGAVHLGRKVRTL